jgi:dolichyl-phosphate-mannose--protein O-mannosyl transferase
MQLVQAADAAEKATGFKPPLFVGIIPALAGTSLVAITILLARELNGHRYAQFLAGLCILLCPAVLVMSGLKVPARADGRRRDRRQSPDCLVRR